MRGKLESRNYLMPFSFLFMLGFNSHRGSFPNFRQFAIDTKENLLSFNFWNSFKSDLRSMELKSKKLKLKSRSQYFL